MSPRRTRTDLRERLVASALAEFGSKGFDGASTRAIAQRADAHQPQINYHFASKEALWIAAVDHLFDVLQGDVGGLPPLDGSLDPDALAAVAADRIRGFVHFAAAHPELNQIMVHEATVDSERLRYLVDHHVRPLSSWIRGAWEVLREAGVAAPLDPATAHHVIVGAASLPYVNAPEVRLLTGRDPTDPAWVEAHAEGLVATLLPGLRTGSPLG